MGVDKKICVHALKVHSKECSHICTCLKALSVRPTFACEFNNCPFRVSENLEKLGKTDKISNDRE